MKKEYWLERWERLEIGFHQSTVNPYLCEYWEKLNVVQNSAVFVPLCGKSRDMLWLREQGHSVLGIEFSSLAVQAFFAENGYTPQRTTERTFKHLQADDIRILCGDFFDLCKNDLAKITAVYDRAALVALPLEIRRHYVHHLLNILPADAQILLITLDYPDAEMSGPPFAVTIDEVVALYQSRFEVDLLVKRDVLAQNPRFQERGLSRLHEYVFLLKPHRTGKAGK